VPACAPAHTGRMPWRGRARKLLLALAGQAVGSEANTVRSAPPATRCRSSPAACALTAAAQAGGGRSGGSYPGAGVPQAKRVCASRRPDLLRVPGALAQSRGPARRATWLRAGQSDCLCRVCCSEAPVGARAVVATAGVCLGVRCSRGCLSAPRSFCGAVMSTANGGGLHPPLPRRSKPSCGARRARCWPGCNRS